MPATARTADDLVDAPSPPSTGEPREAPSSADGPPPDAPALKTCRCGHDRRHPMVSPNPKYPFIGWCAILIGISWEPRHITFTCRRCGETFDRIDDPREIKRVKLFG